MNLKPLDAVTQCESYGKELATHVRNHPLLSLGIAAGVGALVTVVARQAAGSTGSRKSWLADLADELSDHAHEAAACTRNAGQRAQKEFHAASRRATDALPDVAIDRLVRQGRRWIRANFG